MTKQLEEEKAKLIEKKRQEQEDRQRKQLELERILEDNRRLVRHGGHTACSVHSAGSVLFLVVHTAQVWFLCLSPADIPC